MLTEFLLDIDCDIDVSLMMMYGLSSDYHSSTSKSNNLLYLVA